MNTAITTTKMTRMSHPLMVWNYPPLLADKQGRCPTAPLRRAGGVAIRHEPNDTFQALSSDSFSGIDRRTLRSDTK
jgi:hypothetical protein